jgi:hypothetical protein
MLRQFNAPVTAGDMYAAADAGRWCLDLYGAKPRLHFLKRDGLRCACVFDAPDAEAMRNVLRNTGLAPPLALFSATVHPDPADGGDGGRPPGIGAGTLAVVERLFAEPVTFDGVNAEEQRNASRFDLRGVRFVRSYFAADRRRMICLYDAPTPRRCAAPTSRPDCRSKRCGRHRSWCRTPADGVGAGVSRSCFRVPSAFMTRRKRRGAFRRS